MLSTVQKITLKMWEKTMMPETNLVDGVRQKTGNRVEFTTYTFTNEYGDKLVFLSKENQFRPLEGETGELQVKLAYDDFRKRNLVKFVNFNA